MNRVTAIASLALADAGHAENFAVSNPAGIESTLRIFNGTNFEVRHIPGETGNMGGSNTPEGHSADIHVIRAAIASNARLALRLSEHGVRVQDIVNAALSPDGGIVFYCH
ncbi:hypothetical protein [Rhizobium sp. S96]|uniref:hypothetical protein n=1 Tax=Rhizobium sp. S96 TaxID=3055140 RepID=UPI0025AB4D98|nr:hypothetical protein [Rhizobium sp. S96]MDM9619838.1 hypothetical protein [Rhizobium sp. S96]